MAATAHDHACWGYILGEFLMPASGEAPRHGWRAKARGVCADKLEQLAFNLASSTDFCTVPQIIRHVDAVLNAAAGLSAAELAAAEAEQAARIERLYPQEAAAEAACATAAAAELAAIVAGPRASSASRKRKWR